MGARGPKKGFKLAKLEGAAKPLSSIGGKELSNEDRENPLKLAGDALRALAYRNGFAKSELAEMSDEKIREQMQRRTVRRYEELDLEAA